MLAAGGERLAAAEEDPKALALRVQLEKDRAKLAELGDDVRARDEAEWTRRRPQGPD